MSEVKINCDHVLSWFKHEGPRFRELYERMQLDFANQDFGYKVCLHEAAHAVVMELDGIQNVRFSGPEIYYNFESDVFGAAGARITGDDQPNAVIDDGYIFMRTKHIAAGGIALRKFMDLQENEAGGGGDYADFRRLFRKNPPTSGETPDGLWKRAQEAVDAMLDNSDLKEKVLNRADEYLRLLYPDG